MTGFRGKIRALTVTLLVLGLPASLLAQSEASPIEGVIAGVGQTFGNLNTNIPASRLELEPGSPFSFSCKGGEPIRAVFSSFYSDVPSGEWLGLANEEGQLQLAINFGDANSVSGCGTGDAVSVSVGARQ